MKRQSSCVCTCAQRIINIAVVSYDETWQYLSLTCLLAPHYKTGEGNFARGA